MSLGRSFRRTAGVLTGVAVLVVLLAPTALADDSIYWTASSADPELGNQIYTASLDGSSVGPTTVVTTGATVSGPLGVALDPAADRVYWSDDSSADRLSWANLDGSGGGDLDTTGATVSFPAGIVVDHLAGRVYWANTGGGSNTILLGEPRRQRRRRPRHGTGATMNAPVGTALDRAGGRIYWTNYFGQPISWANLDGSGGGDLDTTGATVDSPWGLAIDPTLGRIYWANTNNGSIGYASLSGGDGGVLPIDIVPQDPRMGAFDPATGRLYWTDAAAGLVHYTATDGSGDTVTLYPSDVVSGEPTSAALLRAPARQPAFRRSPAGHPSARC